MLSESYIKAKFQALPAEEQVKCLLAALDEKEKEPDLSKWEAVAQAMNLPILPALRQILQIEAFTMVLEFQHGEQRRIDFRTLLNPEKKLERQLLETPDLFQTATTMDGALAWPKLGIHTKDWKGKAQFAYFDIDPGLLYEKSVPVSTR